MTAESGEAIRLTPRYFLLLLASMLIVLVLAPQFEDSYVGAILLHAGLTAVFITGVIANRQRKVIFRASLIIAVVAIPLTWFAFVTESVVVQLGQNALIVLFCGVTGGLILSAVLREYLGAIQAVLGAICVYLLIGLAWATIYSAIERIEPQSFDFNHRRTTTTSTAKRTRHFRNWSISALSPCRRWATATSLPARRWRKTQLGCNRLWGSCISPFL